MKKIKTIKVKNLKAISEQELNLNGCTVLVTGRNNSGKSTLLRALPDRLRGLKPDVILKHNESEGYAEWELTTGEKFIWTFNDKTKAGERLIFVTNDKDGNEIRGSITEEIMKRYFPEIFDVDEFLQSTPAKQRLALQKISGLDFTQVDDRYKVAFEDRTFANKKVNEAKLLLKPIKTDLPTEEVDLTPMQTELSLIDAHNEKYKGVKEGLVKRETMVSETETEIKRLKTLLNAAEAKLKTTKKELADGYKWAGEKANQPKDEEYATELNNKIVSATVENEQIKLNNANIEAQKTFDELVIKANDADKKVKDIIEEKDKMIADAKLPDGFGFSDDGITYNGLNFTREQLSSSGIYIAALKLASMNKGEVKTLHFDASFLDKNSLAEIEAWAESEDLQLLIERPDFEGGEIEYHLINETK